ncbi:P-loop containing nucleoside triphosphate hydrolase, partial [Trinorchestia longiramus]
MTSKKVILDWLVVSVTGATGGGKSELCTYLYKNFPSTCRLLRQDDYFLPEDSPKHVKCSDAINHFNWDILTALDMDKMFADVEEIITTPPVFQEKKKITYTNMVTDGKASKPIPDVETPNASGIVNDSCVSLRRPVLILDGFCLLDDLKIREVTELSFFFELSREECNRRRNLRNFDPPDVPGYFDECVWPMYEQYRDRCKQRYKNELNLVFLSGNSHLNNVHSSILSQIVEFAN